MKELCPRATAGLPRHSYALSGKFAPNRPTHTDITNIQAFLLYCKRKAQSESTIKRKRIILTRLATLADLQSTNQIETEISELKKTEFIKGNMKINKTKAKNTLKRSYCEVYASYCKFYKIEWEKPIYKREPIGIQPPSQERIERLITACKSTSMSLRIAIMAQTGLRPIEITGLKGLTPNNIHPDTNTITALSTKGCNPRPPMKITPELMTKLSTYITTKKIKPNEPIFPMDSQLFTQAFIKYKKGLAKRTKDYSYLSIRLYDLRHFYITKQLRKTQNAEIVRQIVGHKLLNTTQKYLHLLTLTAGEWITEQTNDKNRAEELLKNDFTYQLTTPDGYMIFRKPK